MIPNKTEKQHQRHLEMLRDCRDALVEVGIRPLLSGSALLGTCRDGDLVPWERGIVLIYRAEELAVGRRRKELKKALKRKGFLRITTKQGERQFKFGNWDEVEGMRLLVELPAYYLVGDDYVRRHGSRKRIIPRGFFEREPEEVVLRGETFLCPSPKEEFLRHLYGDWHRVIRVDSGKKYRNKAFMPSGAQ